MKKIVFILSIAVLMISCNKIMEGEIIEKWHEDESMTLMLIPQKVGKVTIMQQYWVHDDEDFCVKIKGLNQKGKIKTKVLYLDKEIWSNVEVGENIVIQDDNWTQDEDEKTKAEE